MFAAFFLSFFRFSSLKRLKGLERGAKYIGVFSFFSLYGRSSFSSGPASIILFHSHPSSLRKNFNNGSIGSSFFIPQMSFTRWEIKNRPIFFNSCALLLILFSLCYVPCTFHVYKHALQSASSSSPESNKYVCNAIPPFSSRITIRSVCKNCDNGVSGCVGVRVLVSLDPAQKVFFLSSNTLEK